MARGTVFWEIVIGPKNGTRNGGCAHGAKSSEDLLDAAQVVVGKANLQFGVVAVLRGDGLLVAVDAKGQLELGVGHLSQTV